MKNNKVKIFIDKYFSSFGFFYRKLKHKIFIRLFLSISVGVLDGLGLTMFLPLLKMSEGTADGNSEDLGKLSFVVKGLKEIGLDLNLITVLTVMVFFFILKGIAQYISQIYSVKIRQYFIKSMRVQLSQLLSSISYKSFVKADAGRIQNTMTGEISRISNAFIQYFGAAQQFVLMVVYMVFAFFADSKFAILILVGGFLSNLIFSTIYKKTKEASREITKGSNIYQRLIIQFVGNFKYLKATGRVKNYNKKLIDGIEFIERKQYRAGKLGAIGSAIREPLMIIVVSVVILVQVQIFGGSLSTILISLLFFYRALTSLMFVQTGYNGFLANSGSLENVTSFEKELRSYKDSNGTAEIKSFGTKIEIINGNFKYDDTPILRDINLEIAKNQSVAFVGESGSGKTTLVNILVGLLKLDGGKTLIDGYSISDININSYQSKIGYITQEAVIFNDTIRNNITLWDQNSQESNVQNAINKAHLSDFIKTLPDGLDTMLGNNGVNLSGGQKQRISIARELFKEMDILVLDEATSALDSETEKSIQESIDELKGEYTIITIAHRLATIKNADTVILMDDGEILAQGSFDDLKNSSPKFKKMVELQEV